MLFTIGHSSLSPDHFIRLLKDNKIQVLVDVRSWPYSRFVPQFNKDNIQKLVKANRIKYLFLGKKLGGMPEGEEFYDSDGHVLYSRIARSSLFAEGLERLIKGTSTYRVAIMCSEENPVHCHRRLLVGRVLARHGLDIRHIRMDGRVQSEGDILKENGSEQNLFETEDRLEWKSVRPVKKGLIKR